MPVRVSEYQGLIAITANARRAKADLAKYSEEVSSGIKVANPGDSNAAGLISQYRDSLRNIDSSVSRATNAKTFLTFQEDILAQVGDAMIRAKEIASQGASDLADADVRSHLAKEVFAIRDQISNLANSTYQGKYVWGGIDDDDPPYDAASYSTPATGPASQRYVFDDTAGENANKSVVLTDVISVDITSVADDVFTSSISALERLGRALSGYTTNPASGSPDGTGTNYTFPQDQKVQTLAIRDCIDLVDSARVNQIETERTSIGARMRRIETAESILSMGKLSANANLDNLQNADIADSATNLSKAQQALEASYTVTSRVLKMSILDYL